MNRTEVVVLGKAVDRKPIRIGKEDAEGGATIKILELIKGDEASETLRVLTGDYGRATHVIPLDSLRAWEIGERYVFLLQRDKAMSDKAKRRIFRIAAIMPERRVSDIRRALSRQRKGEPGSDLKK